MQVDYYEDIRQGYVVCFGSLMEHLRVGKAMVDWLRDQGLEDWCEVKLEAYLDDGYNELIIVPDSRLRDETLNMIKERLKEVTKDVEWKLMSKEIQEKIHALAGRKDKNSAV
jgi:hypothetical protein